MLNCRTPKQRSRNLLTATLTPVSLVLLLLVVIGTGSPSEHTTAEEVSGQPLAPVPPVSSQACSSDRMCSEIVSGTITRSWVVTSTVEGLKFLEDYHAPTFDQWVLPRSDNSVTIVMKSKAIVDTEASFPLELDQLDIYPKSCTRGYCDV